MGSPSPGPHVRHVAPAFFVQGLGKLPLVMPRVRLISISAGGGTVPNPWECEMTIVALWKEEGSLWLAADTRVSNDRGIVSTDSAAKLYSLPVVAMRPDNAGFLRLPHWWTSYGFAFAGAVLPATMTAITATTLLQQLTGLPNSQLPPRFEEVAAFVRSLAARFMDEHYSAHKRQGSLFSAALAGWCPYDNCFKVGHIWHHTTPDLQVTLSYPDAPADGQSWVVLGSDDAKHSFDFQCQALEDGGASQGRVPLKAIEQMVAKGGVVGGAVSLMVCPASSLPGASLFWRAVPAVEGQPQARRLFNGIDLDQDLPRVGNYMVGGVGMA